MPHFFQLLRDAFSSWSSHKASKMGAALAYYTTFSLAPLVILMLSLLSLFMHRSEAVKGIVAQISQLVGADGAKVVQEILAHSGSVRALSWSTVLSLIILWVSASGAIAELQDSLNMIWEVPPQKHRWRMMFKERLLSLSMVIVLGFFMLASLLISTGIAAISNELFGGLSRFAWEAINTLFSMIVISALFASLFRMLPEVRLAWSDVMPGAILSGALFLGGKFLLSWYIARSAFASSYGAAASFVVILFWVFYSAQILYFGAEFTRAYTRRHGSQRGSKKGPPASVAGAGFGRAPATPPRGEE